MDGLHDDDAKTMAHADDQNNVLSQRCRDLTGTVTQEEGTTLLKTRTAFKHKAV